MSNVTIGELQESTSVASNDLLEAEINGVSKCITLETLSNALSGDILVNAENVVVDSSGFDTNLNTSDNNVQKIMNKIDVLQTGGGESSENSRVVELVITDFTDNVTTGDQQGVFIVPDEMDGMFLVRVAATVITAGDDEGDTWFWVTKTGIDNDYYGSGYMYEGVEMLWNDMVLTGTAQNTTRTSEYPGEIDVSNSEIFAGDIISIHVEDEHDTPPKGLIFELSFSIIPLEEEEEPF